RAPRQLSASLHAPRADQCRLGPRPTAVGVGPRCVRPSVLRLPPGRRERVLSVSFVLSVSRRIPPGGESRTWSPGNDGVMGYVVEEHEAAADGILEIDDVQAAGQLVEAIAVASGVEAKQAAEHPLPPGP